PTRGRHLALTKLLANQGSERASFSLSYRGEGAGSAGAVLVFFGGLLLFVSLLQLMAGRPTATQRIWFGLALVGGALAVVGIVVLSATWLWLLAALALALVWAGIGWLIARQRNRTDDAAPPTDEHPTPASA
ncbi:MAG: hypothetical protein ACI9MR_003346, partial [Myxococcota bacterium]